LTKGRIYARAAVSEYWIVNLKERSLEIYRDPDAEAGLYPTRHTARVGETARAASVAGLEIAVADLFI